jgi:hypothetical protein
MKNDIYTASDSLLHIRNRAAILLAKQKNKIFRETDRLFAVLMPLQYISGIIIALVFFPKTWTGNEMAIHPHVFTACILGALISGPPVFLALTRPGEKITRWVIACCQMLTSALLIHLTNGRTETHFHIFGSLALIAMYRDWKVMIPATLIVTLDHFLRGIYFPESVYGIVAASSWRTLEHAAWVVFEDIFLIRACFMSVSEMKKIALNQAQFE